MTSTVENADLKFPGVFVKHKGHKEMCQLKSKLDGLGSKSHKQDAEVDSPKSNQSEEFTISSCTSSCSVSTAVKNNVPQHSSARSTSSECGLTTSDSISSTEDTEGSQNEVGKLKRSKRKKNKEKSEENTALDPIRYKTKMCKNWQQHEKCPYGPRCLFAHGTKEMRTYTLNHTAISSACSSSSPERQFYAIGHFPNFMPVPFTEITSTDGDGVPDEDDESAEAPAARAETPVQYTHSPYASLTPAETTSSALMQYSPETGVIGDPYSYFPHARAYHPHLPVFPQPPFVPPECAVYAPAFPHHLHQYHHMTSAEMYPMPFYQPVR